MYSVFGRPYYRSRLWYSMSSVCRLSSVTFCIVAKRLDRFARMHHSFCIIVCYRAVRSILATARLLVGAAVVMARPFQSSPGSSDNCWTALRSRRVDPQTKSTVFESASKLLLSLPTIAIIYVMRSLQIFKNSFSMLVLLLYATVISLLLYSTYVCVLWLLCLNVKMCKVVSFGRNVAKTHTYSRTYESIALLTEWNSLSDWVVSVSTTNH